MEVKKTKRANVYRKRGLYFVIGLLVSISLTITAFEWKFEVKDPMVFDPTESEPEPLIEIPVTTNPPPPKPIQPPKIVIVEDVVEPENEVLVIFSIESDETLSVPEVKFSSPPEKEEIIFLLVEENAYFPGGNKAYGKFLRKNLKYPAQARRMRIEGKVYVQFIINPDGSLSDIKAIKGIGAGCDEEAVRVIRKSPDWNPGKQRGRAVKQRMVIPIVFRLN